MEKLIPFVYLVLLGWPIISFIVIAVSVLIIQQSKTKIQTVLGSIIATGGGLSLIPYLWILLHDKF